MVGALVLLVASASAGKLPPTYLQGAALTSDLEETLALLEHHAARDIAADGVPDGTEGLVVSSGGGCCVAGRVAAMGDAGVLRLWSYGADGTLLGVGVPEGSLAEHFTWHWKHRTIPAMIRPVPPVEPEACTAAHAARAAFSGLGETGALDGLDNGVVVESAEDGWRVLAIHGQATPATPSQGSLERRASAQVDASCVVGPARRDPGVWEPNPGAAYAVFVETLVGDVRPEARPAWPGR